MMSAFTLRLTREEIRAKIHGPSRQAGYDWLSSIEAASFREAGPGPWDIQELVWDGEAFRLRKRHSETGEEMWWAPPIPPPAEWMTIARPVAA